MEFLAWAFYAFLVALALGAVALHYRLREPPGRGRGPLIALRTASLALLLLLLFDPRLPAAARGRMDTVVLLDRSLSMRLPDVDRRTRWESAREAAAGIQADRVLGFGGAVEPATGLPVEAGPDAPATRLEPALRAAAEAGARRVVVVTDGGVEDAPEALALADRAGLAVEVMRVGAEPAANAGLVEVSAPGWLAVGEETAIEVGVAAIGAVPESLAVVVRRGGRELSRTRVESPPPGRITTATLRFAPTGGSAVPVRLDVALEGTDAIADDDVRSVYVRIAEEPAGVVLVSFRPDQEPRFLLPVLERALGVPARGWLALPGGRFLRVGAGREAGSEATTASVARAVAEADLVVLHGVDGGAPAWARDAAASAPGALIFPADGAVPGVAFAPGPARAGDWYPVGDIPSSPVAGLMAGVDAAAAPPLTALRTGAVPAGWWAPLEAQLGRRGEARPVLAAGEVEGRRVAVALGDGYWRWAFAGPGPRALYDRLWAAVAGWLLAERGVIAGDAVTPASRSVARGEPVSFRAAPGADSVRLRLVPAGGGDAVVDTVLVPRNGEVAVGVLAPGHYRYEGRAYGVGEGVAAGGTGELTVESHSPEFTRLPVALGSGEGEEDVGVATGGGRPARASVWPYALLVLLLCAEWFFRRRWGLR